MPKVTDSHRQARRDQIADAALQVLQRNGFTDASVAQIAEESGLSIGAIYANFENKADIARYLARRRLAWRIEELDRLAADGQIHTPPELLRTLLASMFDDDDRPPLRVILQFWSEALVTPELHAVLTRHVEALRASLEGALRPWADHQDADDAARLAAQTARVCMIMSQGYLANRALFSWMTPEDFVDTVVTAFGSSTCSP